MLRELFVHLHNSESITITAFLSGHEVHGIVESMAARSLILLLHVYRNRAVPYSRSLFFLGQHGDC